MVNCIFCKREIRDEFLYCPYCGKPQKLNYCNELSEKIREEMS